MFKTQATIRLRCVYLCFVLVLSHPAQAHLPQAAKGVQDSLISGAIDTTMIVYNALQIMSQCSEVLTLSKGRALATFKPTESLRIGWASMEVLGHFNNGLLHGNALEKSWYEHSHQGPGEQWLIYTPLGHLLFNTIGAYVAGLRFHELYTGQAQQRLSVFKTIDRKSTRLNSSHSDRSRMPSSA